MKFHASCIINTRRVYPASLHNTQGPRTAREQAGEHCVHVSYSHPALLLQGLQVPATVPQTRHHRSPRRGQILRVRERGGYWQTGTSNVHGRSGRRNDFRTLAEQWRRTEHLGRAITRAESDEHHSEAPQAPSVWKPGRVLTPYKPTSQMNQYGAQPNQPAASSF